MGRAVQNCSLDFGGIKLAITGDFLQLLNPAFRAGDLQLFESETWKRIFDAGLFEVSPAIILIAS
jgi:hypothetical protein